MELLQHCGSNPHGERETGRQNSADGTKENRMSEKSIELNQLDAALAVLLPLTLFDNVQAATPAQRYNKY